MVGEQNGKVFGRGWTFPGAEAGGASPPASGPPAGSPYDARASAQQWAQRLLGRHDWLLLDTETTGIDSVAEVVQIGVLSPAGDTLLDALVRPRSPIPAAATAIHGITDAMVARARAYPDVYAELDALVRGKTVVAYNAQFDARLLRQTALLHRTGDLLVLWQCAMEQYARYVGRWSSRHGHFMWQRLPRQGAAATAKHQAIDDCRATLDLIRQMAAGV